MPSASAIDRRSFLRGGRAPARSVAAISNHCLARVGIVCMTCREVCPEQIIRLEPRIGGPFLPEVIETACTGCGACIAPCPVRAINLIERDADADV